MALLKYIKPAKDHLPDPRRSLATSVPLCTIVQAKLEVSMVELQYALYMW